MSRTRTPEQLVLDVRVRCHMVDSEFVTDDEILEYINQELAELRTHIRRAEGQTHARTTSTIAVTPAASLYSLPSTFWELIGVEATINGVRRDLEPFMENERARLVNANLVTPFTASPMYRIMGTQIEFLPQNQTYTATIKYVPAEPRLRLGMTPPDTVDGYQGYEIMAVYGACATCLAKEESDASFYAGQKDRILRFIQANAAQRDAAKPERVTDVAGTDILFPWEL